MSVWKAIQAADYGSLLSSIRKMPEWSRESADAVHSALVAWCERALAAPVRASDQSAAALYDLIGRLRSSHGEEALDSARPGSSATWRAFEEVLNERVAKASRGDSQREAVLTRRYVPEVLQALHEEDSVLQQELRMRLSVSESTLSQVLARMEAAMLIVRERDADDGRTRRVRLADTERQRTDAPTPGIAASVGDRPHRGIECAYLTRVA